MGPFRLYVEIMRRAMKAGSFALALVGCLSVLIYGGAASAQIDLSGNWNVESTQGGVSNGPGPFADDFAGIPINDSARRLGFAYSGDEHEELNRQCEPWSVNYWVLGPWGGRFTAIKDSSGTVIGWHVSSQAYDRLAFDAWTDGRAPPPPQALHTYDGFVTGQWEGDTLHTTSTHLKDAYLNRNGIPMSNQATTDLYFSRHGDEMMLMGIVTDPVYLAAPWALARTLRLNTAGPANDTFLYCLPAEVTPALADGYHTAVLSPVQQAAQQQYMKSHYNLPRIATDGGPETMFPEFARKIAKEYTPPSKYCSVYCCVPAGRGNPPPVCPTSN